MSFIDEHFVTVGGPGVPLPGNAKEFIHLDGIGELLERNPQAVHAIRPLAGGGVDAGLWSNSSVHGYCLYTFESSTNGAYQTVYYGQGADVWELRMYSWRVSVPRLPGANSHFTDSAPPQKLDADRRDELMRWLGSATPFVGPSPSSGPE